MYRKSERGFTFVEMLMVTTVLTFVTSGTMTLVSHFRGGSKGKADPELMERGRVTVDQMVREIGRAGYPAQEMDAELADITSANSNIVADTFLVATPTQVIFEADLDNDSVVERIEYRLHEKTLWRSAVPKNSDGSVPQARYEVVTVDVDADTPLFSYTVDPQSAAPAPGNITSVRISLGLRALVSGRKNRSFRTLRFEGIAERQDPNSPAHPLVSEQQAGPRIGS